MGGGDIAGDGHAVGAHGHVDGSVGQGLQQPITGVEHVQQGRIMGQHGDHHLAFSRRFRNCRGSGYAVADRAVERRGHDVEPGNSVACRDQVTGHRPAHIAEADKAD